MQFKHPELLWALLLLLIPLFIHLFQLRKFKKTPFTNVKLLQKVIVESRKSNQLKKLLLLCTRLLLLTALVLAFAQPFIANKTALQEKETVIYLDDSFSMQAKTNGTTLLGESIQDLVKAIPEGNIFSLFTNTKQYRDVTLKEIQDNLLSLSAMPDQLEWDEVLFKANTLFSKKTSTLKNLIVVSDFQERETVLPDSSKTIQLYLVKKQLEELQNIVVDSAYQGEIQDNTTTIHVQISSTANVESTPVSLYNDETLIAKTSAKFNNQKAEVIFSIPNNEILNGKIEITDIGLAYDNQLYFNINQKEKIKVLAINEGASNYLERIFTNDEFILETKTIKNLNYSELENNNTIIINNLKSIPNALNTALLSFRENGGSIVIIPNTDTELNNYNQLLKNLEAGSFKEKVDTQQEITTINFSHPLYSNVFNKKVSNFQYPFAKSFYTIQTRLPKILSYGNGNDFLVGDQGLYVYTSSLANDNSNFTASPLIVPTFYNMGINSLKLTKLYHVLDHTIEVDVPVNLASDHILHLKQDDYQFIPQQQSFASKTRLTFTDTPTKDGIYVIEEENTAIQNISFNYPRMESKLAYQTIDNNTNSIKYNSITELFNSLEKDNSINELWKWFIILALFFILTEIFILKFFK